MFGKIASSMLFATTLLATSRATADYAAIAYAKSTGSYGYSYGYHSRAEAETEALSRCRGSDKKVVVWVHNGWCALALSHGRTYGYGFSTQCRQSAKDRALRECAARAGCAHIAVSVFSGYDR
jgi:hypothetical protein